ncbi:MAG: PSD1 and planctomycete cytochrome C domain-containing protein [Bryobacteraceae bacterium]
MACLPSTAADKVDFFETHVRPVLARNCFACHTASPMAGLAMVSSESLLKGGKSGPAIIPGKPDDSLLIQAVSHTHARLKMPPQGELSALEIADLRTWVEMGAPWPITAQASNPAPAAYRITPEQRKFWSFQPVRKPEVPAVKDTVWAKTPIDHFVLAQLEKKGLRPVKPAERNILLRRVYLDLIGLPPTPEQTAAFLADRSSQSLAKVVDQLLASPKYGERWGRHWLDVARYTDDKLNIVADEPYPNAFRFRDWVIQAFNDDMPYDKFVKAQIAADLLPSGEREKLLPGLGFYGMSAQYQEDRADVTGKAFLGLTVGCAQCHDHKFDPIPTRDYYSLLGVFISTKLKEYPLAPADVVKEFDSREKSINDLQEKLNKFLQIQSRQLAGILASRIVRYLPAAWKVMGPQHSSAEEAAKNDGLDAETLDRWIAYLRKDHEHTHLKQWTAMLKRGGSLEEAQKLAVEFQATVLSVATEIEGIEEQNLALLGGASGNPSLAKIVLVPYPRDKYVFWRELFGESRTGFGEKKIEPVLIYAGEKLDRFLQGEWKSYVSDLRAELTARKKDLPPKYPFLHSIEEADKPANLKVYIRGNPDNLGEEAPRAFLSIFSDGPPKPFTHGSGRLELAEAIANARNPLFARVMVNRIWLNHFGQGIVRTPSNFGQLGARPTSPELLDYLAARFVESGWSMKAMHREMVLSSTYALSTVNSEVNFTADPENRLLWRANRRRLDVEVLRDSMLATAGELVTTLGGSPLKVSDQANHRRTVYSFISRRDPDETLALFDFPGANDSNEQRLETSTPLQRLYFLNSAFAMERAKALAVRLKNEAGDNPAAEIHRAYELVFSRPPSEKELKLGVEFLRGESGALPRYTQALFATNEFQMVN